jgi:lysozyme family protein
MNNFFSPAFNYLLKNEGTVFTNDSVDPGGATKFGITKKSYEAFVGQEVDVSEISTMTMDRAEAFYTAWWEHLGCDKLEVLGTAVAIFDCSVLYGPIISVIMAQKAASLISAAPIRFDGMMGEMTLTILNGIDQELFIDKFHDFVLAHINKVILNNPSSEKYRKGWTSRAGRLLSLVNITPIL